MNTRILYEGLPSANAVLIYATLWITQKLDSFPGFFLWYAFVGFAGHTFSGLDQEVGVVTRLLRRKRVRSVGEVRDILVHQGSSFFLIFSWNYFFLFFSRTYKRINSFLSRAYNWTHAFPENIRLLKGAEFLFVTIFSFFFVYTIDFQE
jgi:hypothetical protein